MKNFKGMTKNEIAIATRYMNAFIENFGNEYIIEKNSGYFYVHKDDGCGYVFNADNINTINGWLYGCVQTKNGMVK